MTGNDSMHIAAAKRLWRKAKKTMPYTSHLNLMLHTALSAATTYNSTFMCHSMFMCHT